MNELEACAGGFRKRTVRVHFADGNELTTDINGTVESVQEYYEGEWFNIGNGEYDLMAQATRVEFLA